MKKVGYCSVTYLFRGCPEELGLDENCSKEELEEALEKEVNDFIFNVKDTIGIVPNDVEIEVI